MRHKFVGASARPRASLKVALLTLFALIQAVPLLIAEVVPLGDYAGHLARYHIQLNLEHSPALQRWYEFEWRLTGNLGADLIIQVIGPLLGVETAGRLIAAAIPPLFVAGLLAVSKAVHQSVTPGAIAATPLAFALPYQYGFINYWLAISLALLSFAIWVRVAQCWWRPLLFGLIAPTLFVCHVYGWGVLAVLIASWQMIDAWQERSISRLLPLFALLTPMPLMLLGWGASGVHLAADFFNWEAKLVFMLQPLRDQWLWLDLPSAAMLYALIVVSLYSSDFRRCAGLVIATALFAALFILLPRILLGSILADMRLVPILLAVGLLAAAPAQRSPWLLVGAIAFATARLVATTASFVVNGQELARELEALPHIPRGAALVTLYGGNKHAGWRVTRGGHLPSYAVIRREAFASDQFIYPAANPLRLKAAPVPGIAKDMEHHAFTPAEMARKVALVCAGGVDALWIISDPRGVAPVPPGLRVIWRSGSSAVFAPARSASDRYPLRAPELPLAARMSLRPKRFCRPS